ncbi:MAG: hypothetical protein AAFP69_23820, partial [Planctomycetota bacterium]
MFQSKDYSVSDGFFAEMDSNRLRLELEQFALSGVRSDIQNSTVTLIQSNGAVQRQRVSERGSVTFDDVDPGVVGVVVTGPRLHATSALLVQNKSTLTQDDLPSPRSNTFVLPPLRINPSDVITNVDSYTRTNAQPVSYSNDQLQGMGTLTKRGKEYFRVSGGNDGKVVGQLWSTQAMNQQPNFAGTVITIFRDGQVYDRFLPNDQGAFQTQRELTPGYYGIVAAGSVGYAAFGFQVTGTGQAATAAVKTASASAKPSVRLASANIMQDPPSDVLDVMLIPPQMFPALREAVRQQYEQQPTDSPSGDPIAGVEAPLPGGGFGGGGVGAGGGFGGGGGGGDFGGGFGGGGFEGVEVYLYAADGVTVLDS